MWVEKKEQSKPTDEDSLELGVVAESTKKHRRELNSLSVQSLRAKLANLNPKHIVIKTSLSAQGSTGADSLIGASWSPPHRAHSSFRLPVLVEAGTHSAPRLRSLSLSQCPILWTSGR